MLVLRRTNDLANASPKRIECDRLVQNNVDRARFRAVGIDLSAEPGKQNDGNVLVHLLHEARGLLAVHFRHRAIHNDKIEITESKFLERFPPATSGGNGMVIAA